MVQFNLWFGKMLLIFDSMNLQYKSVIHCLNFIIAAAWEYEAIIEL